MRNGVCAKCKVSAIYATSVSDPEFTLPTNEQDTFIGKAVSSERVATERYVCTNCGYFETYIADRQLLRKIETSNVWMKV